MLAKLIKLIDDSTISRKIAKTVFNQLDDAGVFLAPIVTEITPLLSFYPAEDYHQDYYKKNKLRYKYYRTACGRDKRLKQLWGE